MQGNLTYLEAMLPQIAAPRPAGANNWFPVVFRGRPGFPRRRHHRRLRMALFLSALITIFPAAAHAYIDPNTGGYVFQALFPIVSAIIGWYVFFRENMKKVLGALASRIRNLFG